MTWIVSTDSNQGRASQLLFSKTMKPSIKRTYHSHLQKEGHGHKEVPTDREIQRERVRGRRVTGIPRTVESGIPWTHTRR